MSNNLSEGNEYFFKLKNFGYIYQSLISVDWIGYSDPQKTNSASTKPALDEAKHSVLILCSFEDILRHLKSKNKKSSLSKTPADQLDIFCPKLFYYDIVLRLKSSQCTIKKSKAVRRNKRLETF